MREIQTYLEHTLLRPDATMIELKALAMEAARFKMYAICVNPYWVEFVRSFLVDTDVKVVSVVGFPLGASASRIKASEARLAIKNGADEIDMVLNTGAFKSNDFDTVVKDIKQVKVACGSAILKVILETALLTSEQITQAAKLVASAGADIVKTSTGFSTRGASLEDIKLIKQALGPKSTLGIKAAGGIKTYEQAVAFINAGATRIGTSQGAAIVQQKAPATSANY